jgi:PEP-CTERM motif
MRRIPQECRIRVKPNAEGSNAPFAFANPIDPEEFFYDSLDPSTSMMLDLFGTPTGNHVIPLVTAGIFDGPGFSFALVSPSCTGIVGCDQAEVGLTPGSTIFGAVTIAVSVTTPTVPEPSTWWMILLGFAGLAFVGYRRTRAAVSAV